MTITDDTPQVIDEPVEVAAEPAPVLAQSAPPPAAPAPVVSIADATFEDLFGKPRRTSSFNVTLPGPDGGIRQVRVKFAALEGKAYDDLVAAHPPTKSEAAKGSTWNAETFPAALISAVSVVPKMTVEQAKALLDSPNWAAGEALSLFQEALAVCSTGLNVPFNAGD